MYNYKIIPVNEYVYIIGTNDTYEPDALKKMYDYAVSGDYDMLYCGSNRCILPENKIEQIKYGIFGFGYKNIKRLRNKFVKKEIYEKIKFCKKCDGEDCFIACQLLYYSQRIGYFSEKLYHRKKIYLKKRFKRKTNYERIIEFCKEKFGNDLSIFEPELSLMMGRIKRRLKRLKRLRKLKRLKQLRRLKRLKRFRRFRRFAKVAMERIKGLPITEVKEEIRKLIKYNPKIYFRNEKAAKNLSDNWNGTIQKPQNLRIVENAIPVVLCANDKFAPFSAVMLQSILDNSNPQRKYHFIIFERNFSGKIKKCFINQVSKFPNCEIDFIDMSSIFDDIPLVSTDRLSVDIFSRLFIPFWFDKYSKVIYLDSDMIAKEDIALLYDLDLQGYCLGAAVNQNTERYLELKKYSFIKRKIDLIFIENWFRYINSGVLVFDTKKFAKEFPYSDFFKFSIYFCNRYAKHSNDQSILSISIQDNYFALPPEWNYLWHAPRDDEKRFQAADSAVKIIHFASRVKPWHDNPLIAYNPDTIAYRNYAKTVPLYAEYLNKGNEILST
jgi:lipopolysaccharide biosynthesis glycosyltransferase